ncbi:SpoIIE family protein phosphatase [Shewanella submarina]|uniref:SpoIIE family protein phosphatase n=1 Tax=Shewanella submarina TaxID=2016376 RepID=A0ABV7GHP2_9GAMM|nr:SpoIIE family protein phosphatase [Shewanella submarina]MCL1038189.1 SpoIIE family protein phosphatase [Shewanella submarina]
METCLINEQRPCNLEEIRDVRLLMQKVLKQELPDPTEIQHMLLCFSELATNIARHSQPVATELGVKLSRSRQGWKILISDNGGSWHSQHVPHLQPEDMDATGGRGLSLISHYVDEQSYRPGSPNHTELLWRHKQNTQPAKSVLLVEDDPSQQRLLQAYLKDDYRVLIANDGTHALQLLEQHHVDLILSDVNMPGMNGLTLRDRLNKQSNHKLIPFIFITHSDKSDDTCSLGIDDLLPKPVTKSQLLITIQRVLNRSEQICACMSEHLNQTISAALQPSMPGRISGWRIAYGSRSAGSGGGDFVLTEYHPSGMVLMLVDILGHSIESKFFSYAYAGYLRGILSQSQLGNTSSAKLQHQISAAAARDKILSQTLMTCCVCQLTDRSITISCAGHPSPLRITPSELEPLDCQGPLPGLLPDASFGEATVTLSKGERLAIYTDGIFESGGTAQRRKNLETVMRTALSDTLSLDIDDAITQCMNSFDRHAGSKADDDATLILIEKAS